MNDIDDECEVDDVYFLGVEGGSGLLCLCEER